MRTSIAFVLLVASTAAWAQDKVQVGKVSKNAFGTVVRLENADTACNMYMKDDSGRNFSEAADFDICHQKPSLVGKRVALKYGVAKVLAASCQGNPDCRKSDTIVLVQSATIVGGSAAAPAKPAAAVQASHCTSMETNIFSCTTGARMVSVCASKAVSPTSGYVQYRFGKPGEPLEMTLPESHVPPPKAAYGANVAFSGGGGSWMRFRNGPTSYVVYSGIGRWGKGGGTAEKAGVVVEKNGKQAANVKCVSRATGELGPGWFEKAGYRPDPKQDFDFPD